MAIIDFFAGLMAGRQIAAQRVIVPVIPTATHYLYGVPSEAGNIGLRSGGAVTMYDGAVLPKLPEWDKTTYPYAYICTWDTGTYLILLADYEMVINSVGKWAIEPINGSSQYNYSTSKSEWYKPLIPGGLPVTSVESIKWANFDILNEDGSVYLSASDPIPVSGIVGYSYNGTVLPELPEWDREKYPYALLNYYGWPFDRMMAQLVCYSQPAETGYNDDGDRADWVEINGNRMEYNVVHPIGATLNSWGNPTEYTDGSANRGGIWSNTDIVLDDGTLYLSATDPIPVYETKE